jgi:hypothetical protein
MFFLSAFSMRGKTAYLVPEISIITISDHSVIKIFDRGGDQVYFNNTNNGPMAKYKAVVYVDTQSGSHEAVPAPLLTMLRPGDMVCAYYTGSGFILTNTLSGLTFPSLPGEKITVRFIDATSHVLIAKEDLVQAGATPAATTTTAPSTHVITVSWSPPGLGDVSSPGGHGGGGPVTVVHGAGQTFICTPDQHPTKAVFSIVADGVTVYTGSSAKTAIPATFNNVVADHTLVVTLGNPK